MLGRRLGSLGRAGIDDDDLRVAFVAHDPLPQDGVGDAQVRADQHDHVAFLEVGVGVGRCVEAKGLLVGGHRGGHALAGVGVAVEEAHTELEEAAEKGHLLEGDLPRGKEGDRLAPVLFLDVFEAGGEGIHRFRPAGRLQVSLRVSEQGDRGAVRRVQRIERLPAFRAGHAEVHRVAGLGAQVDGVSPIIEVKLELAAGRAVATDRGGGGGRFEARRNFSQPELPRLLDEVGGERSGVLLEELGEHGKVEAQADATIHSRPRADLLRPAMRLPAVESSCA